MGQERGLWFPPWRLGSLSPGLNPSFALSHSEHQDMSIVSENFAANMFTVGGSSPVYAPLPLTPVREEDKSLDLVYGLPNVQSQLVTPQKPCLKQISPSVSFRNRLEAVMPKAGVECAPKRFLVFDQSGDQTTLIFSSGDGKPFEGFNNTGSHKHPGTLDMKMGPLRTNEDLVCHQGNVTREEFAGNSEPDVQSEMHEDTEELNALLCSDDESDYSDEDEVTSSGHSPSTISAHFDKEASVGSSEFVRHSQAVKRKLLEGCDYETLTEQPLVTSNSPKRKRLCPEDESDAESSCASSCNAGSIGRFMPPNGKKMTETLRLLRGIVPGGDMEDPISVIDRAIEYLKSLKDETGNSTPRDSRAL